MNLTELGLRISAPVNVEYLRIKTAKPCLLPKTGTIPCEIRQGHQKTIVCVQTCEKGSAATEGNGRQTKRLHKHAGGQKTGEMATIQRELLASIRTSG